MKTISKKIKTIYLLAMMAIISVCIAVFPVFKTETVKADEDFGLSMTGATVELSKVRGANDFALMFQAKISRELYDSVVVDEEIVYKFGMAILPASELAGAGTYEELLDLEKAQVFDSLVGKTGCGQLLEMADDATEFIYEAGTYFYKDGEQYQGKDDTWWKSAYATDISAIPFLISVEGEGEDAVVTPVYYNVEDAFTTSAKTEAITTIYEESALPVSQATMTDEAFTAITGIERSRYYTDADIYLDQSKNYFFSDFQQGVTGTAAKKNFSFMQWWSMYKPGSTSASDSGLLGPKMNAYFAGVPMIKRCAGAADSLANVSLLNCIDNCEEVLGALIPGETYRVYFDYTSGGVTKLASFEYTVATTVFTNLKGSGDGAAILASLAYNESQSAAFKNSFFTYGFADTNGDKKSEFYLPYTHQQAGYTSETGYNGYYVLAGDLIVPDPVSGSKYKTTSPDSAYSNGQTHEAPSNLTTLQLQRIAALKQAPDYTNKIEGQYIFNNYCGGGFTGTFDGRGYTIETSFGRGGLFGAISGGTVKNLNIKADFYNYKLNGTQVEYADDSYMEKAATLAEVIYNGSTIENVSIELKESAPKTFYKDYYDVSQGHLADKPDMDNVPGIIAAQGIYGAKTKLKNVIVKCDTLKDANKSIQNYRAALNIADDVSSDNISNLFVIGSSYTNMSLDAIAIKEGEGEDAVITGYEYILKLSAPEGVEPGTYVAEDDESLAPYFAMAKDMFKFMRNIDVSEEIVKVIFVDDKATGKFATDEDFQAYLSGDGAKVKQALIKTKMWKDKNGALIWANEVIEGTTYTVVAGKKNYVAPVAVEADLTTNFYNWVGFDGYNPNVTLANGTQLA